MEAKHYHRAESIEDAHKTLQKNPGNVLLGGGLWIKKTTVTADTLIDLSDLKLDQIKIRGEYIEIGAMTSLRDFETNPKIKALDDGFLSSAASSIMGVGFRRIATIGGTIAGRFPFSDLLTALLTLDVTLVFYPQKEMSLREYLDNKGKSADILTHILIKKAAGHGYFKKVSDTTLDFAILNIAVTKSQSLYSIAIGSRPAVAALAEKASEYLNQKKNPGLPDFEKAGELAAESLAFGSTPAASQEYRKTLARVYVRRGLEEVSGHEG